MGACGWGGRGPRAPPLLTPLVCLCLPALPRLRFLFFSRGPSCLRGLNFLESYLFLLLWRGEGDATGAVGS